MNLFALVHPLKPLVPVLVGSLQADVQVRVGLLRGQVDHVKLGVDVHQPPVLVHDGQGRDPLVDELVQGLNDGGLLRGDLHQVVRPNLQVEDRVLQVLRLRHVVDLGTKVIYFIETEEEADETHIKEEESENTLVREYVQHIPVPLV